MLDPLLNDTWGGRHVGDVNNTIPSQKDRGVTTKREKTMKLVTRLLARRRATFWFYRHNREAQITLLKAQHG